MAETGQILAQQDGAQHNLTLSEAKQEKTLSNIYIDQFFQLGARHQSQHALVVRQPNRPGSRQFTRSSDGTRDETGTLERARSDGPIPRSDALIPHHRSLP